MEELRSIRNRRKRWYDKLTGPMGRLAKWAMVLVFLGLAGVISIMIIYGWRSSGYDMARVSAQTESTRVFGEGGESLGSLYNRAGIRVTYDQIPPVFIQALLAREDVSFEKHGGIALAGIIRSMLRNARDLSYTQGGSTITMQLARNVYELGRSKSLDRKLLEMAIALRIEKNYSKQQILESYVNRIYFGAGAYGVGDAARTFFGKDVSQLNLGESALLAGVIRAPSVLNPFASEEKALRQRDDVLDRMVEEELISEEEGETWKKTPLKFSTNDTNEQTSYPLQWVKKEIDSLLAESAKQEEEEEESGLVVQTSFNLPLQRHVERSTELALQKLEKTPKWTMPLRTQDSQGCIQAAVLVVKPGTGSVLAMLGGRDSMQGGNLWTSMQRPMGVLFSPVVYSVVSESNKFIVRGNPYESARNVGDSPIIALARKVGIKGELPHGKALAEGEFEQPLITAVPLLLALNNKGYMPELYSVLSMGTPSGFSLFDRRMLTKGEELPALPPDAVEVVYKMSPFIHDLTFKTVSLDVALPARSGYFSAYIHSQLAVFVWVGQVNPNPSFYESAEIRREIQKTASSLVLEVFSFVIPVKKAEVAPTETEKKKKEKPAPAKNRRR